MADKATITSNLYQLVNADPVTFQPISVKQQYYLPPSAGFIGAVKQGTNITIANDGTISAFTGPATDVTGLAVGQAGTLRTGNIRFINGNNVNIVDNGDNSFTWNASGSGAGRLDQLSDVRIVEPTLTNTTNTITAITATTITVSQNPPLNLAVNDFIRGDNTVNGAVTLVTAIAGNIITVLTTTSLNFTTSIFKVTPTTLDGFGLVWSNSQNAFTTRSVVQAVQANGDTGTFGNVNFVNGTNTTVVRNPNGSIQINSVGGGGGGAFSTITSRWTNANSATKNAQTSPSNINNDGITIALTASSNPGTLTNWTITLNGTALVNTYPTGGAFPNYTVVIPVADITGNAVQTAATVTVALANSSFNLTANNLINNQPVNFTTMLSGAYTATSLPYYTTTTNLNYSYTNQTQIISFGGVFTPTQTPASPRNATSPLGQFTNIDSRGCTISGNAIGNGLNGAAQGVSVNLSGSVAAVPSFVPAWLSQTPNITPPAFTTADAVASGTLVTNTRYQTGQAAQGTTITYPVATAFTQYNWICTQRPLANIFFLTAFGPTPLVPDVTAQTQTIAGQVFSVYGFTRLSLVNAAMLQIT